jgi:tyrosyl-tRNA synthetase
MMKVLATEVPYSEVEDISRSLIDIMVDAKVSSSKGEARRLIKGGGVSVNGNRISDERMELDSSWLLQDGYLFLKVGKKKFFVLKTAS